MTVLLPKKLPELLLRRYAALSMEAMRAIYDRVLLYSRQFVKPLASWEEQLAQSDYHCYLLLAPNVNTGIMTLEEGQWVGMFALQGPLDAAAYNYYHMEHIRTDPLGLETRWLGLKLYLKEQHRNLDAMQLLRYAVMNHIEQETRSQFSHLQRGEMVVARLQSSAYVNTTSHKYHASSGAAVVGELTRRQDLEYDGYLEEVPREFLDEDPNERVSTVFEYVVQLAIGELSSNWI